VTPSVKKKERAKRHSMVHSENDEGAVCVGHKKNKRSESQTACKKVIPAAKLIVVDDQEEAKYDILDIDSQVDLPKTGNFGGYNNELADESNGGKTGMEMWTETSLQIFWQMTPLIPLRGITLHSHTFHIAFEKRTE
jgi:hypothetical protein